MNNKQPHSLRVAYENWINEDRFKALIVLLQQYDTGIGQIALFSSAVHTPLTLAETRHRAEIMAKRIVKIKEAGYHGGHGG